MMPLISYTHSLSTPSQCLQRLDVGRRARRDDARRVDLYTDERLDRPGIGRAPWSGTNNSEL